ncbi:DUF5106 domain-containing protein [Sphingobacterium populi]|uniref:DUF5106 domain-containing protein n=1 Tax=Sphingobacterium sp. CFCC 11742 TaxID=1775560 RepID=UPI0018D31C87|nr:DUF5106 domain-containing protein [Sphingobacterium sp. CFCC 11742]
MLLILFSTSCKQQKEKSEQQQGEGQKPAVTLFWDKYNLEDTVAIVRPEIGEQAIVDFITIAQQSDSKESVAALKKMLQRASQTPAVLEFFVENFGKYLYNPNSSMYNEELYLPVLEFMAQNEDIPQYEKQRFEQRLALIRRNNAGTKATNFVFQTPDGKRHDMYSQEAPYTLLFFYEPGCGGCASAIENLQPELTVQEWIRRGDLQILAIYATAEYSLWKDYQQYIPPLWINGINTDRSIIADNLYDLKASPTFYLLDSNKVVLLKDRNLAENILYLGQFLGQ